LKAEGFRWGRDGALEDADGRKVRFSIVTPSSNPERVQMATLIQADLKALGIAVDVVPLEFRSLLDRLINTRAYDAAIMALASPDADPNAELNVWLSTGTQHAWNPGQKQPATAWEAEIDRLMRKQMVTRKYAERKQMFDRVQHLLSQNQPLIPLVSPNVLVGAKQALGNFRPALLEPYALWNVEELYWQQSGGGVRR
jgi:peptide/nickel transport system substrate-binding protein